MDDEESRYSAVLRELTKLVVTWQTFKDETLAIIVEHRKTVNSAISSLAQESLESQADTKQRLESDATIRASRQKHTDRKDVALLSGLGCLIVLNGVAIIVLAVLLVSQNWR